MRRRQPLDSVRVVVAPKAVHDLEPGVPGLASGLQHRLIACVLLPGHESIFARTHLLFSPHNWPRRALIAHRLPFKGRTALASSLFGARRFTALNGTAVIIGVVAGIAAVGFRWLIDFVENLAFRGEISAPSTEETGFLTTTWGVWVFLVPLFGGIFIGIVRLLFPDLRRQGIAEVIAAVQARSGIIKGRTAWGHAVLSAITVGTGGSTGREGPIGYIGAALGSSFGRRLGFKPRDIKVLLGCGTAAGIAATFNAPLGGVLFAMELILPEFSTHAFIPVVAATVIGVTVAHSFLGDSPAFHIPTDGFVLVTPYELLFYMILGLVCGLGGVMFIRMMGWAAKAGEEWAIPVWQKPAVGGLFVGLLGLLVFQATSHFGILGGFGAYHIYGTGYGTVNAILSDNPAMLVAPLLGLLIVAKPLASSITIGSGGGGGVFSASLMQGAFYGALLGLVVQHFFPGHVAGPAAYALVGMGAFYAATGRATLTTIVLMSELTQGYAIVLPLMFAAVTADAVSVGLSKDSIYTVRLRQRGIVYEHDRVQSPLDSLTVGEIMTDEVDCLVGDLTVREAFEEMLNVGHTGYPVVDGEGRLLGVVTRRDLSKAIHEDKASELLSDVISGLLITVFPEEHMHRARDLIFEEDIGRLIVVDPHDRRRLLGIVTRSDLLRAEAERDIDSTSVWQNP